MFQIIFSLLMFFCWGQSAETKSLENADGDIVESKVREFLPEGSLRSLTKDDACPGGLVKWVDNETMAFGLSGSPALFHAFDSTQSKNIKLGKVSCALITKTSTTKLPNEKKPNMKITQTTDQDCGAKGKRIIKKVLTVVKQAKKYEVELVMWDGLSAKPTVCKYER